MTHSCTTATSGTAVPTAVDEAASAMWSGLRVSRRALSYPLVSVQLAGLAGRKTGMRVIHGIWARDALCLWAEDPDLPAAPRDQAPSPALHPFCLFIVCSCLSFFLLIWVKKNLIQIKILHRFNLA